MAPKELRNLKRLIKSGDEENIRLALEINEQNGNILKDWLYSFRKMDSYIYKKWLNCYVDSFYFVFYGYIKNKISAICLIVEKIDVQTYDRDFFRIRKFKKLGL